MNYNEELNKALNNIFFDGLKSHVENCTVKKLGNNWTQKIAEYTDNWHDPLDFNKLGDKITHFEQPKTSFEYRGIYGFQA